jgi:hypothetical protein
LGVAWLTVDLLFVTSRGRSHRELAIPQIARVDIPRNQVLLHLCA